MFNKRPLTLAASLASAMAMMGMASLASAQSVKVDINANVEHSVNGVSNFGRERRIMVHASAIENDFLGEKEKLDYLMDLGVAFGRDTGVPMFYFSQTQGDRANSTPPGEPFPFGHPDEFSRDSLDSQATNYFDLMPVKYPDAIEYFNRGPQMIMSTQPRPSFPNWSSYSWFGGALTSDDPWRPRTMLQGAEWHAAFLEEFYLRNEGDPGVLPMPEYWEVVNEPDMQMNTTGPEGHVSTWEALWDYHNVVANTVRARLGNKAPKIGGMTWGLHDLHLGDSTAFGAPRLQGDALLNAFYANDAGSMAIKNRVRNGIFAASNTMGDPNTSRDWYQWDVIWKGFLDAAGSNMDFYSIHLYDWPKWKSPGGRIRTGMHSEGVMDLLEWYDTKMVPGARKEVIVSEYGAVSGIYLEQGTTLDRTRMRWEKLKPFSQMMMQFMERPDYITASLPFITVKATWGDQGKTQPYAQTLLDRDYSTCEETATEFTNCTWNFNPAIHWYELWRDVDGTRVDTYSSDRDIQVDAYVNNDNGEHHLYVIVNSMHIEPTDVDLSFAGISGNAIQNVTVRHLYLDEAIDADGNSGNGVGKPIMAEAQMASLPDFVTVGADATMIIDIKYANNLNPTLDNKERKYPAEPLTSAAPYRVSVPGVVNAQINGVPKPANGEAQLRITGAFFINGQLDTGSSDSRVSLSVNGNNVEFDADWRGEDFSINRLMSTLEIPFPVDYLSNSGNNSIEFSTIANGQVAAVSLQVWDMDTQLTRSQEGNCSPCTSLSSFNVAQNSANLKVTNSVALTAQFTPASVSNKKVTWVSSNPSIASVDQNGIVTGTGIGNVTITATSDEGGIQDQVSVNVSKLSPTSVNIVGVPSVLYIGSTKQLSAAVRPIHAPNRAVTWTSNNPGVATVTDTGVVEGVSSGTATIRVVTDDGNLEATATIRVQSLGITGFSISPESTLLPVGDSFQISWSFTPSNASNQSITWTSSNNNIARVNNGLVTGVADGQVTITAVSNDSGLRDTTSVRVVSATSTPFFIESESFSSTGGAFGGFAIDAANGLINDNQVGDWGEYQVNFGESGTYQFILDSGAPDVVTDGAVILSLNDSEVARGNLPSTGDWNTMVRTVVSNNVPVPAAGTYTVRLTAAGPAGTWVWNSDKFGFRKLIGDVSSVSSNSSNPPNSSSSRPSPSSTPSSTPPSSTPSPSSSSSSSSPSGTAAVVATNVGGAAYTANNGVVFSNGTGLGGTSWSVGAAIAGTNDDALFQSQTFASNLNYAFNVPSGTYKVSLYFAELFFDANGSRVFNIALEGAQKKANYDIHSEVGKNTADIEVFNNIVVNDGVLNVNLSASATDAVLNAILVEPVNSAPSSSSSPNPSSSSSSSSPSGQAAFVSHAIPGLVQAENFDTGGEGIAYNDTTNGNAGNAYRTSVNVDIQATSDAGGGNNVGWIANNEWLEYTIGSVASGTYDIDLRIAASGTGSKGVRVLLGGQNLGTVNFNGTGGWQNWQTVSLNNVTVSGGANQVLRLEMIGGGFNMNWVDFDQTGSSPSSSSSSSGGGLVDQCNTTAQCKTIYGNTATDCEDSRSNMSICLCGNTRCDRL